MWFEDIVVGTKRDLGSYTMKEDEIIAFAKKYDPQPFHIDPQAAAKSVYGGIIASGWHTTAIWMKMMIASRQNDVTDGETGGGPTSGVSPGFENLRWVKPVRPGDTLYFTNEVMEKVDLKTRPLLGLVKTLNEARDKDGNLYMTLVGKGFVARKNPK